MFNRDSDLGAGLHRMEESDGAIVVVVPRLFSAEVEAGENVLRFDHTTEFVYWEGKEFVFKTEVFPDVAAVVFVDNFNMKNKSTCKLSSSSIAID